MSYFLQTLGPKAIPAKKLVYGLIAAVVVLAVTAYLMANIPVPMPDGSLLSGFSILKWCLLLLLAVLVLPLAVDTLYKKGLPAFIMFLAFGFLSYLVFFA